jgi:hypothetical protein
MNTYYIYFHRNSITHEIFYVGKGTSYRAYAKSGRGKYYINYIKKYGAPIIEIIKKNLTNDEAKECEINYIKLFGRRDIGTGILVNCTDGGEGCVGLKHTEETKKMLSDSKKNIPSKNKGKKWKQRIDTKTGVKRGKYKQRKDKGRIFSLEVRKRMGKGREKRVMQFDKNNVFIKEWKSITEAENELKINGIRNVLCGDSKTCGGFIWKY